jgi:hypothetical protein
LGTGNAKSETEKRSVAPLFVEEKRKKTHKISRFWVLLLLLLRSLKKAKVQQKYNSFTNTASILNLIIAVKMKLKIGNNRE